MKEEFKQFNINIDDIEPIGHFYDNLQKAIDELRLKTLKNRFEVVLNNNLIMCVEKITNYHTVLGCRISFSDLPKDISFIVREDTKPSYETLENRIDEAIEYINEDIDVEPHELDGLVDGEHLLKILKGEE